MIYWIKKGARLLSGLAFFIIFFSGLNAQDPFDLYNGLFALLKGLAAAFMFWLLGFVIGDIILKNMLEEVDVKVDDMIEGGLIQRIGEVKSQEMLSAQEVAKISDKQSKKTKDSSSIDKTKKN